MTSFDNKEKAEENKYAHEKEQEFRIYARYHSLLAAWAAEKMHLNPAKAEDYKNQLVTHNLPHQDNEALLEKVAHDFQAHKVSMDKHEIRKAMHHMLQEARKQVLK